MMIIRPWLYLVFNGIFLVSQVHSDTLTLRNNAEINGHVRYADEAFTVISRYSTGSETRTFDRREVRSLEFNDRDFNSDAPPNDISIFKERVPATRDASHEKQQQHGKRKESPPTPPGKPKAQSVLRSDNNPSDDIVWLRDKKRVAGRLIKVENGQLTLQSDSKEKNFDSGQVASVLIAPN